MTTLSTSVSGNDQAFFRQRQAMLMFPLIVLPFLMALFWIFKGGKGERYVAEEAAAGKPGAGGFNASVPTAKGGSMNDRTVESPGFGKAAGGQVLSDFTHTSKDSITRGLKAIPVANGATGATSFQQAVAVTNTASPVERRSSLVTTPAGNRSSGNRSNTAALVVTGGNRQKVAKGYYYQAPGSRPYYPGSATDQQLDQQLKAYETTRNQVPGVARQESAPAPVATDTRLSWPGPSTIQLSDNLAASRLADAAGTENAFNTAPTEGSRRRSERAVLSSGNSYGSKKTIAWMIPVVVHEDQAIKEGQQVKLRLLKEISADGITIPANSILYATCQLSDDRLRLTVRSLQQGSQLIPLDLDVYDTDGSPGINVPGLAQNSQIGGQMRSSAIQGVNVPGVGGLANNVINTARLGASTSARNTTIRLRAGYNLFLKAQ
jgi:hypothetical protein